MHVLPHGFHRIRHYACWPAARAPTTSPERVSCSPFQTPRPSPPLPPPNPASRFVHAAAVA
ncbi:hypothetical protein [Bradyrhizobium algeriense]|uniref:hypothetical protein n=1 Tax=Bradyrhizobium algeriense TaxID=634784 RepID=UPI002FF28672